MLTLREQQVLALVRDDPMLSQQAIAQRLGISRSAAAGHIMNVTSKGYIRGRGYVVIDAPFVSVIGGANIDIHGKSAKRPRRHDSNPGAVSISAGGVARNVAENLARLGIDCRLISAIGNDYHGQLLRQLCHDAGIDMQFMHEIASAPTSTYLSVLDDAGDMQVAVADMRIIDHLDADRLRSQQAMLAQSALLIVDTNLGDDALAWLMTSLGDVPLFVDTVSTTKAARLEPFLSLVHTLKTSTIEAASLTGMPAATPAQLRRLAATLHAEGVKRVFITRGDKGVFFSTAESSGIEAPLRRERDVQNVGGAGDAFLAGLAYAWLHELPVDETLRFALAAADITLSHSATSSPAMSLTAIEHALESANV